MNIKIIILGIACLLLFLIPGYIFNIGSLTGIFLGAALVLYGYHYTTANAFLSTNHLVRNGIWMLAQVVVGGVDAPHQHAGGDCLVYATA